MRWPLTRAPAAVTLTGQSGGRDEEGLPVWTAETPRSRNVLQAWRASAPTGTVLCPIATQARGQPTLPDVILARLRASSPSRRARHRVSPEKSQQSACNRGGIQARMTGVPLDYPWSIGLPGTGGAGFWTGRQAPLPWASSGFVIVRRWDDRRGRSCGCSRRSVRTPAAPG
jgi:hypothetical protein